MLYGHSKYFIGFIQSDEHLKITKHWPVEINIKMPINPTDTHWMSLALRLAERGLGTAAPNPAVGCIIVKNGRIIGRGYTQSGGRPHAESVALQQAGAEAKGATAYVSLEPCAHHGQTPPCAAALVSAGLKRVVTACEDPDSRVAGRGHAMIKDAGVAVSVGVLEREARALNAGFFMASSAKPPADYFEIGDQL